MEYTRLIEGGMGVRLGSQFCDKWTQRWLIIPSRCVGEQNGGFHLVFWGERFYKYLFKLYHSSFK